MKRTQSLVIGAALVFSLLLFSPQEARAQLFNRGGSAVQRLEKIDNPPATVIASNATTAHVDFSYAPVNDYFVKDLSANLTLYLTNLMPGRTARVFIDTDGSARNITVATNGVPHSVQVFWSVFGKGTNGAPSLIATNQTWITLTVTASTNFVTASHHAR